MLDTKYLCKFTTGAIPPATSIAVKYIGNYEYFGQECSHDKLFELLYDRPCIVGITRPFKVTLDRSEWYWHAD